MHAPRFRLWPADQIVIRVRAAIAVSALALALPAVPAVAETVHVTGIAGNAVHGALPEMSDAEMAAAVGQVVRHLASEIKATPEQTERMTAVLVDVAREIAPIHARMTEAGTRFEALLMAEQVDRAALESLRAEHMAEFDRVSRILVDRLADLADILEVEQRKKLRELAAGVGMFARAMMANP